MGSASRLLNVQTTQATTPTTVNLTGAGPYLQGSSKKVLFAVENIVVLTATTWTVDFLWVTPAGNTVTLATATLASTAANTIVVATMNTTTFAAPNVQGVPFPNRLVYTQTAGTVALTANVFAWFVG